MMQFGQKRKYRNTKVEHNGITFDSKRERDRYLVLKDAERKGLISDLELQPKYILVAAVYEAETVHLKTKDKVVSKCKQRAITYTADFRYKKPNGEIVVEDVKASEYMIPKEYVLKEKMMYAINGIKIKRVYKPNDII